MDHPFVTQSVEVVRATLPPTGTHGVRNLFKNGKRRHFHRACLGIVNQVTKFLSCILEVDQTDPLLNQCFQQISGINLITYYAATIYEQYIGLTPTLSRILAACNGTEYFLASWIAVCRSSLCF